MHASGRGKGARRVHMGVKTAEREVDGERQHELPTYWSKTSRRPLFAQPMREMPQEVFDLGKHIFELVFNRLPASCKAAGPPNSCVLMHYDRELDLHINPHRDGQMVFMHMSLGRWCRTVRS